MGRVSNHAVVYARLIIDGNDYGVAVFIVQIRSMEDHKHMPGVKCGDMGPKMGFNDKDNGWLTMDHVRIPRANLLSRYLKVDRDGTFSIEGDLRILYSSMMYIRVQLVTTSRLLLIAGLLPAIRYSLVRRQFNNISGQKSETQLLDYQT